MKHRILHLTPDFNYSDGRSYYVYLLLKYLKKNGHEVYLCTNKGDSFERAEELGINIFTFSGLSKKTSLLKSLKFLSDIIKQNNITVIHSHHRYYELLANSLKKNNNIHTVFTALSIVDKRYFVEFKSDKIIAVSNSVKDMLIKKFKVNETKIILIPNFAEYKESNNNIGYEKADRKSFDQKEEIIILSVGRFHKEKNFATLFEAIALLKNYRIKVILIGEGEEKESYMKIIKENSLNVHLYPPQRNLKEFFDISDICILPSVTDPFPGFMLQSGLYQKAFIGSDVDGISELIEHGENGLLFEKRNAKELAVKIKLFIGNKSLARKCAVNLHKKVRAKYTQDQVIPQIEELYDKLSNEKIF